MDGQENAQLEGNTIPNNRPHRGARRRSFSQHPVWPVNKETPMGYKLEAEKVSLAFSKMAEGLSRQEIGRPAEDAWQA